MHLRRALTRTLVVLSTVATALGLCATAGAATPDAGPPPNSMASLGDSITRGFDACGWYVDCTSRSWSTGDYSSVNSHYRRILAVNPAISRHNYNDARTGAVAADVYAQAGTAIGQGAQYVTVLIGANDACKDSESQMTPVPTFRSQIDSALSRLNAGLPNARILVVSIPDIKRLWYIGKSSFSALSVWALGGICQSMLANATSTSAADTARRDRVRQRVVDFNTELAGSCSVHTNCRFDGNAVFNYQFVLSQVSGWDYFHPNTSGQAVLAQISYQAGYAW